MKRIKKNITVVVLIVFILCLIGTNIKVEAHPGRKHDSMLEEFLFRNKIGIRNKDKLKYLEEASYLMIDQFGSDGQDKLDDLLAFGVKKIEKKVSSISNSSAGGSIHRKYTHRGWSLKYYKDMSPNDYKIVKAKFPLRQAILMNTAKKIFKFKNEKQAEAFCQLIYYIHIFADHDAAFSNKPDRINEVESNDNDREIMCFISVYDEEDLVHNLLDCLQVLFVNQSSRGLYITMVTETLNIYYEMENLKDYDGSVPEENKVEYKDKFLEMWSVLIFCIPDLLEHEKFFADVFY